MRGLEQEVLASRDTIWNQDLEIRRLRQQRDYYQTTAQELQMEKEGLEKEIRRLRNDQQSFYATQVKYNYPFARCERQGDKGFTDTDCLEEHKRKAHMDEYLDADYSSQAKYLCAFSGCESSFARSYDLDRHQRTHQRTHHSYAGLVKYDCPYGWCKRQGDNGFTRTDHLREHKRKMHPEAISKGARSFISGG